jgi:hypothetical protein
VQYDVADGAVQLVQAGRGGTVSFKAVEVLLFSHAAQLSADSIQLAPHTVHNFLHICWTRVRCAQAVLTASHLHFEFDCRLAAHDDGKFKVPVQLTSSASASTAA